MNTDSIQIQLRMKGATVKRLRLDKAVTRRIIEVWIETGKLPPGVQINPTIWGAGLNKRETRARLADMRLHFGCPGLVKAYARKDTTYCDYDTEEIPDCGEVHKLAHDLGIVPLFIRDDRTARGWHRTVRWNRTFQPGEIIALQLAMGSDRRRELFNLLRVLSGEDSKRWNLLFDHKL